MAKSGRLKKHDPIADDVSFAISEGNLEKVQSLLSSVEIDIPDGMSRTPLMYAAAEDKSDILTWLIESGADINAQDRNGWCALHFTAQNQSSEATYLLIKNCANPNLIDSYGNGPLWTAIIRSKGDDTIPDILLTAGADIDHKNNYDKSPKEMKEILRKNRQTMKA